MLPSLVNSATLSSPFPLDGGRVGDGGVGTDQDRKPLMAADALQRRFRQQPAYIPTQPSPIEGEGFGAANG